MFTEITYQPSLVIGMLPSQETSVKSLCQLFRTELFTVLMGLCLLLRLLEKQEVQVHQIVFKWIEKQGGIDATDRRNKEKARKVYEAIDKSPYFENRINPAVRSDMNGPLIRKPDGYDVKKPEVDQKFLTFAASRHLMRLKGHASVGGFRASIHNAMSDKGIAGLVNEFAGFE